jgi:hypothetical protein
MASTEVNNLFSVKGRVALVTGGSSGIGLMIAKVSSILETWKTPADFDQGLVTNGAKVYVCGLPSDPIKETVHELNQLTGISGGTAMVWVNFRSARNVLS